MKKTRFTIFSYFADFLIVQAAILFNQYLNFLITVSSILGQFNAVNFRASRSQVASPVPKKLWHHAYGMMLPL